MGALIGTLSACAEPLRWRVLCLLQRRPLLCVCHLQEVLEVPQSTLSSHLRILRAAELVLSERRGTWAYYSLTSLGAAQLGKHGDLDAEAELANLLREDGRKLEGLDL